jgi:subtilisin family serine protease
MGKLKLLLVSMAFFATAAAQAGQSYIVISNSAAVSAKLEKAVGKAGGSITNRGLTDIGVLVAESDNPDFASSVSDATVVPNIMVRMIPSVDELQATAANPPNSGDDDFFFDRQWGHDAVNAPEAWDAGVRGGGATVAVLDGGFSLNHPDIASQVVHWADMTGEGIEYAPNSDDGLGIFSHGMHVAGTIAAADNAFGTIGVAPDADLVLIKVLFNFGSGTFIDVLEGILYAANLGGVDVINMSLGADIPQGLGVDASDVAALRHNRGILTVVAAGNDGRNLDKDKSMVVFPADMPHALSISSTAPVGWGADPTVSLDNLASYSNYGRSSIDFAAPGGDFLYAFTPGGFNPCTVGGATRVCYVWDFVFSTGSTVNGIWYYWSVGTSMAAPHAAGVAALIIGENGGSMHPDQVRTEMKRRAEDLGQRGKDPIYGMGRVHSGYYE